MTVAVMQVGVVRVSMEHGLMPVPMAVRLSLMHVGIMSVFDAALVDAHLRDGSARKVIEALIALDKPYILVTGDDNFGLVYSPDAPCVPKPVDMGDVIGKLGRLIYAP